MAKYGDRAMDFIWGHRDRIRVPAVVLVFVDEAEVYLDGKQPLPNPAAADRSQP